MTEATQREGVSLGHAIKDILVITRRNLLRVTRLPQLLLFATVQPVMFLLTRMTKLPLSKRECRGQDGKNFIT